MIYSCEKHNSWLNLELYSLHGTKRCSKIPTLVYYVMVQIWEQCFGIGL